jgi:hypothetical protein
MTIQQIAEELCRHGDNVNITNTFSRNAGVSPDIIKKHIAEVIPDVIVFQGPTGLRYLDILKECGKPLINLWFDDPLMRIGAYGLEKQMEASKSIFEHYIWDGYWRRKCKAKWNVDSYPIHLAANGEQFYPTSTIFNKDDIVFIGNLHSPRSIEIMSETLPPTYVRLIKFCKRYLQNLPEESCVPSWDVLIEMAYNDSLPGEQKLIALQSQRGNELRANFQWCIWAMSKNLVRIRMLKRALNVGTVRMFADTVQHSHANESETRGLLGEWSSRLNFHRTDGLNADQLAEVYHHGWIQIQATDPQSVDGGIPYRVFQTSASARPLLTDTKPELADAFDYGKEILTYDNCNDFEETLSRLSKDKSFLNDIGLSARSRFEREHTWKHRIDYIKRTSKIGL